MTNRNTISAEYAMREGRAWASNFRKPRAKNWTRWWLSLKRVGTLLPQRGLVKALLNNSKQTAKQNTLSPEK